MAQPPAVPEQQPTGPGVARPAGSGLAVAGLVVGIIALLFSFIPIIGVIAWILGPLAVVFGAVGISRANKGAPGKGMAIAGLILGIVSLLIALFWVIGLIGAAAS